MSNYNFPKKEVALNLGDNIDTVTDMKKIFNIGRINSLCILRYEGRTPSRLDTFKDEPVSKLLKLQYYLQNKRSITVEHSWLNRYLKKLHCPYKKQG